MSTQTLSRRVLAIYCDPSQSKYTLRIEGGDWLESLPTLEGAVMRAHELAGEEIKLTIYDLAGKAVAVSTVHPKQSHSEMVERTRRTAQISQWALARFLADREAIERGATKAKESLDTAWRRLRSALLTPAPYLPDRKSQGD